MKKLIFLIAILLTQTSWAATCRVITGDVGEIIGQGQNMNSARSDASEQCFDRRMQLFRTLRGQLPDEDQSLDVIDQCANVRCVSTAARQNE